MAVYQPSVVSGPDRVSKLRSELGTVQQNCRVFGEILTELSSGSGSPDDMELLEVIFGTLLLLSCCNMNSDCGDTNTVEGLCGILQVVE